MAKSFLGKGWANQARQRKQAKWQKMNSAQRRKYLQNKNQRQIEAQRNLMELTRKNDS